jgi:uncharacterized protein DUF742
MNGAAGHPGRTDRPVRPYVITKGRWSPSRNILRPETLLVAADPADPAAALPPTAVQEERDLLAMCRGTLSLAEAAAHLKETISVVAVLASALIDTGHLAVRSTVRSAPHALSSSSSSSSSSGPPSRETLLRVLDGLRKL